MKQIKPYNRIFVSIFLASILFLGGSFVAPSAVHASQCNDGIDNDGDNQADYNGVKRNNVLIYDPDPACATDEDANEFDQTAIGSIIPCTDKCNLASFFTLINNVINFTITKLFFPLLIFIIAFVGFKYLTAGGNSSKIVDVKKMAKNIVIGVLLVLGAWLVVRTALYTLGYVDKLIFFE